MHETLSAYFDETDKNRKKQLLAEAAVLGAYIKRKGNLIFAGDDGSVSARELRLCFHESLSNVELLNADCYLDDALPDEMVLPAQAARYPLCLCAHQRGRRIYSRNLQYCFIT